MKRYFGIAAAAAVALAGLLAAQTKAADAQDAVVKADQAVVAALSKGDKATLAKYLDPDFSWIDTDGVMWAREDVLRAGLKPLVPVASDVVITEHKYGKVVWIQNNQGNKYAAHFWVERPGGWRLLHTNEIATRPAEPGNVRPNFTVPCVNPCKELPYKALSANEAAAIANWQDQEMGTGHHDMHMGDKTVVIGSTTMDPKPAKTATGPTQVNPPTPERPFVGTAPALYARTWDFGDAVIAIMLQPTWGGKAYWSSRVFGNHNGFWKMEESYHTTIQAAPRMTAVQAPVQQSSR